MRSSHGVSVQDAIFCHASQSYMLGVLAKLSEEGFCDFWGNGTFYRVYSLVNGGRALERDLFEGCGSLMTVSGAAENLMPISACRRDFCQSRVVVRGRLSGHTVQTTSGYRVAGCASSSRKSCWGGSIVSLVGTEMVRMVSVAHLGLHCSL